MTGTTPSGRGARGRRPARDLAVTTAVERHRAALRLLTPTEVPGYLSAHSGLPGRRCDLDALTAFGNVAPPALIRDLAHHEDEYLRACGTAALGGLVGDLERCVSTRTAARRALVLAVLHARASDPLWRVREAAALALHRVGDRRAGSLRLLVADWIHDPDPLVRRAALAGICEPRLLTDPRSAAVALEACHIATRSITTLPGTDRRDPAVRALRTALGSCWSIAVAAGPEAGLPAFRELEESTDPDACWITRMSRTKPRLARLLRPRPPAR
ncbi:HEAT repeat domain-containing protein [Cellulosimicrobium cellulans]|uniref:HEAT repeat domain-containing protein n=1 Tax=Cellulosimicrobium cellulans TaxID=1710 RepID=UPI001C9E84EB|nr:HEAT repeat domain-containing protein [Cellulosimicrobium cellulans]